ncbi:MAG: beta-lactamase family protein [Acidobacteria bacterium]|nr:beta-lactamase family protein [Acidobacteriota bacterium]
MTPGALEARLTRTLASYDARDDTGDISFALASPGRGWMWSWSTPASRRPYFIASATKLYVSAVVMQLRAEARLDLDAPAAAYLGADVMRGLHVRRGVDAGGRITVRQLLAHTSGLADYFEQRRRDGSSQMRRILEHDEAWTFDDVLRITREALTPRGAPGRPGKAFYSDTNYQLLGAIIETVTGTTWEQALTDRVLAPLGLRETWPFTTATVNLYESVATMRHGARPVHIPLAMASVRADGGLVSTASDGVVFLQAFMSGRLFPGVYLDEMQAQWNRIFFPLQYGVGLMRFALPRILSPLAPVPPMIGHSGASGAVLYYVPSLDLYVSGTVNQIARRSLSYTLMTRLVLACQHAWRRKQ